jgi:hypothetical protein
MRVRVEKAREHGESRQIDRSSTSRDLDVLSDGRDLSILNNNRLTGGSGSTLGIDEHTGPNDSDD